MMAAHWLVVWWLMLVSVCAGQEENTNVPKATPLFIKFNGCSEPLISFKTTVESYRQSLLTNLMHVFRRRNPDDKVGGPQVASACTQAAALLDTYRSIRKAYLDFHANEDVQSGMAGDSAGWLASRLQLELEENPTWRKDKSLLQSVKWCIDACLVMQRMLSQRAFSEINESPTSPGNAFNNLLDASDPRDKSHSERVTQYLLARCRDESKELQVQNHVWGALSIGMVEYFFRGQLLCAISAQRSAEDLGLVKAALALSWGDTSLQDIMAAHVMFLLSIDKIDESRMLTDSDKKSIKKTCSGIGKPEMQPFWPMSRTPEHYDEALLATYFMPALEETKNDTTADTSAPSSPTPTAPPMTDNEESGHSSNSENSSERPPAEYNKEYRPPPYAPLSSRGGVNGSSQRPQTGSDSDTKVEPRERLSPQDSGNSSPSFGGASSEQNGEHLHSEDLEIYQSPEPKNDASTTRDVQREFDNRPKSPLDSEPPSSSPSDEPASKLISDSAAHNLKEQGSTSNKKNTSEPPHMAFSLKHSLGWKRFRRWRMKHSEAAKEFRTNQTANISTVIPSTFTKNRLESIESRTIGPRRIYTPRQMLRSRHFVAFGLCNPGKQRVCDKVKRYWQKAMDEDPCSLPPSQHI